MIVAIAAEALEFSGWLAHCRDVRPLDWPMAFARQAIWNGRPVAMLADGAGPKLAAAAAKMARARLRQVDAFISVGLCGALDPALRVNDIFVANELRTELEARPLAEFSASPDAAQGSLLSLDRFLCDPVEKARWFSSGARAVEMEAAGLFDIEPLFAVRVVSDEANEEFALDFNRYRSPDGRFQKTRIAMAGVLHPFTLLRMAKRAAAASNRLGAFLAHCEL